MALWDGSGLRRPARSWPLCSLCNAYRTRFKGQPQASKTYVSPHQNSMALRGRTYLRRAACRGPVTSWTAWQWRRTGRCWCFAVSGASPCNGNGGVGGYDMIWNDMTLYDIILYYILFCSILLDFTTQYVIIAYCIILYYIVSYYIILYCIIFYLIYCNYTVFYCFILHDFLFYIIWYNTFLYVILFYIYIYFFLRVYYAISCFTILYLFVYSVCF